MIWFNFYFNGVWFFEVILFVLNYFCLIIVEEVVVVGWCEWSMWSFVVKNMVIKKESCEKDDVNCDVMVGVDGKLVCR